jgi:hypothetical protein
MRVLPTKPHATYAYPDAFRLYNRTFGLQRWLMNIVVPDDDFSKWTDNTCRWIEACMTYEHCDESFNDTMRWLKKIATTGWDKWTTEWEAGIRLWNKNRPKSGNFSFIKDIKVRDEFKTLYYMLEKEPWLWNIFKSSITYSDSSDSSNRALTKLPEMLRMGWVQWYDCQIFEACSVGQRRSVYKKRPFCCFSVVCF